MNQDLTDEASRASSPPRRRKLATQSHYADIDVSSVSVRDFAVRLHGWRAAAHESIECSLHNLLDDSTRPAFKATLPLYDHRRPLSATQKQLAVLLERFPLSDAALNAWLDLCTFIAPGALPKKAKEVWDLLLQERGGKAGITSKKFALHDLETDYTRQLRAKCAHRAMSSNFALELCIPMVHYVSNLELLLKNLAYPLWKAGALSVDIGEVMGFCPLTGKPTRFIGHPASADVAIHLKKVSDQRCTGEGEVMLLLVGLQMDNSHQYGKKHMNAMVTLYPTLAQFRSTRARETFMTMGQFKLPKEIAQLRKAYSAELHATLYQKSIYTSFVEPMNALIKNGADNIVNYTANLLCYRYVVGAPSDEQTNESLGCNACKWPRLGRAAICMLHCVRCTSNFFLQQTLVHYSGKGKFPHPEHLVPREYLGDPIAPVFPHRPIQHFTSAQDKRVRLYRDPISRKDIISNGVKDGYWVFTEVCLSVSGTLSLPAFRTTSTGSVAMLASWVLTACMCLCLE